MYNCFLLITRCNTWLEKCGLSHHIGNKNKNENLRICSRHFNPNTFATDNRLELNSIPTIFDTVDNEFEISTELTNTTEIASTSNNYNHCTGKIKLKI